MVHRRTLGKDFRHFDRRLLQRYGEINDWGLNVLGKILHGSNEDGIVELTKTGLARWLRWPLEDPHFPEH
jgi:hypothetical protein